MATRTASRMVAVALAAAAGFASGVVGTEATFGRLRPAAEPPLLFSVEVRDAQGALLASPMLVGEEGTPLHLNLSQPAVPGSVEEGGQPELNMSLDLDPQRAGGEAICLGYRLSIDDGESHRGRLALGLGERRSVKLDQGGETLQLQLTVARAGSPAAGRLLRAHRRGRPLT